MVNSREDVKPDEFYSNEPVEIAPLAPDRESVERMRRIAYSDPVYGCDRFFAEAVRLAASDASLDEIEKAKSAGRSRFAEIKKSLPWPTVGSK
jgi:hypothetical protein